MQVVGLGAAQTLIVTGKRRRAVVDYVALNQEMFGGQEEEQEDAPDAEYAPSAARPAAAAGGSPSTSTSPRRLPDTAKTVRACRGRWLAAKLTLMVGGQKDKLMRVGAKSLRN